GGARSFRDDDAAHDVVAVRPRSPNYGYLANFRVRLDRLLHLEGVHLESPAIDEKPLTAREGEMAVGVFPAEISREVDSVPKARRRSLGVAGVAGDRAGACDHDL